MENNLKDLTIGVFAKAAGVNVETIRFYQRKGLLPEPDKPYGSIRRYGEADVAIGLVRLQQQALALIETDGLHIDPGRLGENANGQVLQIVFHIA